jgi:hypothetical protein
MWGHYGSMVMEVYSRPFSGASSSIIDLLLWYRFFLMEGYAPFAFLSSWVLVVSYLCFRFCVFDRPILEEYVY